MAKSKLMRCPFCGRVPKLLIGWANHVDAMVQCSCGVDGPGFDCEDMTLSAAARQRKNRADSIAHWNTRWSPPAVKEPV